MKNKRMFWADNEQMLEMFVKLDEFFHYRWISGERISESRFHRVLNLPCAVIVNDEEKSVSWGSFSVYDSEEEKKEYVKKCIDMTEYVGKNIVTIIFVKL